MKEYNFDAMIDRIKAIKKEKKITNSELAELSGVPYGTLNKVLGSETKEPQLTTIMKMAAALGVSSDYIIYGSNPRVELYPSEYACIEKYRALDEHGKQVVDAVLDLEHSRVISESTNGDYLYLNFPFFPVSAGTGVYLDGDDSGILKVPATHKSSRANYALRVSGDSMQPDYMDGDILLVETKPELHDGELGIFIVNSEGYFKKLVGNTLVSLNSDYAPIILSEFDNVKVLGRVIGKV